MAYVNCSTCNIPMHINPIDPKEFHKRFIDGDEPVHCLKCFKRIRQEEYLKLQKMKDEISDPSLKELAEQMLKESEDLF